MSAAGSVAVTRQLPTHAGARQNFAVNAAEVQLGAQLDGSASAVGRVLEKVRHSLEL